MGPATGSAYTKWPFVVGLYDQNRKTLVKKLDIFFTVGAFGKSMNVEVKTVTRINKNWCQPAC